jgi:hypothetical protein
MKFRAALLASLILFSAQAAVAAVTFTASASSGSGNALSALVVGDVVTIDITVRSDGEAVFGLGGSAVGYDSTVAEFTSGTAVALVFATTCLPAPTGCLAGLSNTTSTPLSESSLNAPGLPEVQFFNGIDVAGVTNTGDIDEGVSGVAGDPQFQLVFTATGDGSTTLDLGANTSYGDNVIGASGAELARTNAAITLTVPEPATMASSLAALGSVLGVVAIRRRI